MMLAAQADGCMRPEQFGARGDGVHDDGPALRAALACGRPVRLGARRYALRSPMAIDGEAPTLLGVPGGTVLLGAVTVRARSFTAHGVAFAAGLRVTPACLALRLERCSFLGAGGDGVAIFAAAGSRHELLRCRLNGHAGHGISIDTAGEIAVLACEMRDNRRCGVRLRGRRGARVTIADSVCDGNAIGMAMQVRDGTVTVTRCVVANSRRLGVLAIGATARFENTVVEDGMRLRVGGSVTDCRIDGGARAAIDCGGSSGLAVLRNELSGEAGGLLCDTARAVEIGGNRIDAARGGVDVRGRSRDILLHDNSIAIAATCAAGLRVGNEAIGIVAVGTLFRAGAGARRAVAVVTESDGVKLAASTWCGAASEVCEPVEIGGRWTLVVPDIADQVLVDRAPHGIDAVLTTSQAAMLGRLTAVRLQSGGDGYGTACAQVAGSGDGAAVQLAVADGRITGAGVTEPGYGYGEAARLLIHGDGTGAAGVLQVGLPAPAGACLLVTCTAATRIGGALADGDDLVAPAQSTLVVAAQDGRWRLSNAGSLERHSSTKERRGCRSRR